MCRPLGYGNSHDYTMDWPDVRGQPWRLKGSGGGRFAIFQRAIGAIEPKNEVRRIGPFHAGIKSSEPHRLRGLVAFIRAPPLSFLNVARQISSTWSVFRI